MKKIISAILAILAMACVSTFVSCEKSGNSMDYYGFSQDFRMNSECDFAAIFSAFEKYQDWKGQCSSVSLKQARSLWAVAEAEFMAVEPQLVAGKDCYFEITMHRYSPVKGTFTPVETIGKWRFPAEN